MLDSDGWVAANALMAAIQLAGLLLVLALTRPWARSVPAWLLLFPAWVGIGLLFQVVVGAALMALFAPPSHASGGSLGGIQPWVFVMVYASFAGQGAALAIAFACYVRARWGPLLGGRTGEVVARRAARGRSWPEDHLAGMAEAGPARRSRWPPSSVTGRPAARSGSPARSRPRPGRCRRPGSRCCRRRGRAARPGRWWGPRTRFWLPAALAWIGSGTLAAFDGLELFLTFGTGLSGSGWSLTDTVLVIEVAIGVLCAAVGALAVTAAVKDAA